MPKLPVIAILLAAAVVLGGCKKNDFTAYALTNTGSILKFSTKKPSSIKSKVSLSGLKSGQTLVRIDYRPAINTLYCITSDNFLCTVNPDSGAVSVIGTVAFSSATLSTPVISFDPTRDELRVIDAQHNLMVKVDGTLDTSKTKVAFDKNDSNNGKTPQLAGIAYHNPSSNASTTTLYALDVTTESLLRVGDDNVGRTDASVDTGDLHTIGLANFNFSTTIGFSIDQKNDTGYAALQQSGAGAGLYTIDLKTGAASGLGAIGDGAQTLNSLVIVPGD